ncbi:hypothetical protein [Methanospirillum lacunae]|uniref:Uncharacterized protein n=1 Tax=Methanospirillum lacunae TaxID=668570 RepID=A0A2V2MT81_9EURY|nr:hypothetical protein [Methanospirillum lacunae]PWR71404.1 hypothetical protein DK846_11095 [Methanospirillum lacunae]
MIDDVGLAGVLAGIQLLISPGSVFEIRSIGSDGIGSGYYNDPEKAAGDVLALEQDLHISGIYLTLNEVNPVLLARRANRIKTRLGRTDATTADADIIRRRWLPVDIDPVRISGVSSSDTEHNEALALAESVKAFLSELGWPDPILADSGNGAHLLYSIDLQNDDTSRDLVKSILELLDFKFSTSTCRIDTANFNAGRIWKVYGTYARKGDNIAERPHRRSRIITVPAQLSFVTLDQMQSLADILPHAGESVDLDGTTNGHSTGMRSLFSLGAWLTSHNLAATAKPYKGGILYSFEQCPFSHAHKDGAFAIQFANGAIFAGCHHDSCGGGRQRWPELRALFGASKPDSETRLARLRSERIRAKYAAEHEDDESSSNRALLRCSPSNKPVSPASSHSEVDGDSDAARDSDVDHTDTCSGDGDESSSDDPVLYRSREILAHGDPLKMMLETFARFHEGDQTVAECFVHSLASRSVINSKGLHVSITGESGKGKSHAVETMKSLIPQEFRLDGRMSDKALFYMDDLVPGTVITLDDVSLSDQMQEILKGVTTSFQKPFPYRTVNTERKPQICTIPERCVWWLAKVEGAGDDQVFNRMLTCWIDDSEEQDQKVLDRTLAGAEEIPDLSVKTDEDVLVCRQIWNDLSQVFVVIPYARRIRFQSAENRRNPDMLLDLIRTNAALCQQQRETITSGETVCVVATVEDFNEAARLFYILNGETGGQATKLTRRESALIDTIASFNQPEITTWDLQQATGWANSSITKLLHGYRSHGKAYSGILEKCPAISFLDRTVSVGDEGYTVLRRSRVYQWEVALYKDWMKGGSVWIVGGDSDDNNEDPGHDAGSSVQTDSNDTPSLSEENPADCAEESEEGKKPERTGVSLSSIHPHDFVRVPGGPERRRCSVCGKKRARYQQQRKNCTGSDSHQTPLVLCDSCYSRAVSKEVASHVLLPGILENAVLVKRSVPSGKCQLCSIHPAVWSDTESRIHLCDSCYRRCSKSDKTGPPSDGSPP